MFPEYTFEKSKDLMIRGGSFYAIWDEEAGLWSTEEYRLVELVDRELYEFAATLPDDLGPYSVLDLRRMSTNGYRDYKSFISLSADNFKSLDSNVTFLDQNIRREDYASKRLPYALKKAKTPAYEEIISTLYDPEEREKIEWAIGAVVSGDSKKIQKFLVFYGEAGAGKSTVLNIVEQLFEGYCTTFDAKSIGQASNVFAMESLKSNPLVAVQHDGDLSRIDDNSRLNSIVSHETMLMNEKYKSGYEVRIHSFLFVGTNKPVKITDAKSGLIRRLIDVHPSGRRIPTDRYFELVEKVKFELGGIAAHCLEVYKELGPNYYSKYRPADMIARTNMFFNFIGENEDEFKAKNQITLRTAYNLYKAYCEDSKIDRPMAMYQFKSEFMNYWEEFVERAVIDGNRVRSIYSGFIGDKFVSQKSDSMKKHSQWLYLNETESPLDKMLADNPAQYANEQETPISKWENSATTLKDLKTTRLHYVKPPLNHIVIDFDLKDDEGNKSIERNIEAANLWPETYAEFSKGGAGVHLHYIYDGDPTELSRVFSDNIEVKVFTGNSSLRRRLSFCNNLEVAHISSGLRKKEASKTVNSGAIKTERGLRTLIEKNLEKKYHPGTKPSVDFIAHILKNAYESELTYDVTDLRPAVLQFAMNSSNHSAYCVQLVNKMEFKSREEIPEDPVPRSEDDQRIVFFDVEVFPNLFLVNWKYDGAPGGCVRMINPTPGEVGELFKMKLVGFNNRRYDNHILYARHIGYSNYELYELSQKIIKGDSQNCFFGNAYNISYTDIYDFASAGNKKSLKKWEIELGLHHQELGLPWDEPVPEDKWVEVAEYCDNDVISAEEVFHHLAGDWAARQILSKLSGLSVNATTNQHSTKIIFGDNKNPQSEFIYTDLSEMFPGYKFDRGKSTYRGETTGEGGYVYAEPGMYSNVALLDIASMHPSSIEALELFGPRYTKRFSDIKLGRLAFKHKDRNGLDKLLGGILIEFFEAAERGEYSFGDVANALKTVINSVYGLTSAKFPNAFKDPRNIDNVVAKRGALFMVDLKNFVQELGFAVAHIKTDSIKIPDATPEIIRAVMDFGKKYGYEFEHEATYAKMCLVNDAVYIAQYEDGHWSATGAQFAHPYVFKSLFSGEPLTFKDRCETRSTTSAMYLDMNEDLPEGEHNYRFIGRNGLFCPVVAGARGGELFREKDGKYYAVGGTKGYRWLEAEMVRDLGMEEDIDESYFVSLADQAVEDISKYGDFEWFVSGIATPVAA